jgi:squalene-hopene/tetraprenyl-beta-curcumene cyclase
MRKTNFVIGSLILSLVFIFYTGLNTYSAETALPAKTVVPPTIDKALKAEIKASIDKALIWMRTQQQKDGSYANHPGITAIVATAFMESPRKYAEDDGIYVKNAIKYILTMVKPDGGIYNEDMPNYNTSIALMALAKTKNPAYKTTIQNGQKYIMSLQLDDSNGYSPGDKAYGGIGYGNDLRPDMSNLKFSLQALKDTGVPDNADVWAKAAKFIERCQNRTESNDQPSVSDDGGFVYRPGYSMAGNDQQGRPKSYGSMTYAGVLSFIHANVDKKDPRVQDAVKWIDANYTVDENPGMGGQGLYYYYHTMSKALQVYGEPIITDSKGVQHNWYADLARKLIKLQKPDGSWINSEDRWMETVPILVTAYAILALSIGYPE